MVFSMLKPLGEIPLAVVDVETTGMSAAMGHRIIEIGVMRIQGGSVIDEFEQLIDPGRPIGPGVSALTGITQNMVRGMPAFSDIVDRLLGLLQGAAVLGHNVPFDLGFLHREFRRCGGRDLAALLGNVPVLDTVRVARRRHGRGGNSLPVLSRRLGVAPSISHRALADVRTTAAVYDELMKPVGGWSISLCDALLHQGGPIDLARCAGESALPWELEDALELRRPVLMEYLDADGQRTERKIDPLHVKRVSGELVLVAHCHLRDDRRSFRIDRVIRLKRLDPATGTLLDE
jgi:DNA polymerase III epsilon subunit family exonuclease